MAAALVVAACSEDDGAGTTDAKNPALSPLPLGTGFDFYVLALSWSPGYCASFGDRANKEQCGQHGDFGFVVHGLWPQFTDGYPEFCAGDAPGSVSRAVIETVADIMPASGLVRHQWKKHGTCTGLAQGDYFAVARAALERIAIPPAFRDREIIETLDPDTVEAAFIQANAGMPADAIAVTCDRRFLRDVRICLSVDLQDYVSCPQVDRRDCQLTEIVVPPN